MEADKRHATFLSIAVSAGVWLPQLRGRSRRAARGCRTCARTGRLRAFCKEANKPRGSLGARCCTRVGDSGNRFVTPDAKPMLRLSGERRGGEQEGEE